MIDMTANAICWRQQKHVFSLDNSFAQVYPTIYVEHLKVKKDPNYLS